MVGVYASAGGREGAPGLHPRGTQSPSGILLRVVCLFISLLAGRLWLMMAVYILVSYVSALDGPSVYLTKVSYLPLDQWVRHSIV